MAITADLLVFTPKVTPRIGYIFQLMFGDILGLDFRVTSSTEEYKAFQGPCLCYDTQPVRPDHEILIVSAGLLTEKTIDSHQFGFLDFEGSKAFFAVYGKSASMPFDLFSAAFYLVSRYEEYLPYMRDEHGRFSAGSSMAMQQGFLRVPVVNKWAIYLGRLLQNKFPKIALKSPKYKFIPTIDIDAAWAYKNKGLLRTIGGYFKDLSAGDLAEARKRTRVVLGLDRDPFDTFDLISELHNQYGLKPWFFILFAEYGLNDKNIPPNNMKFQFLVKSLGDYARVGIHPSYASNNNPDTLKQEISRLSNVLHREITASRQHFLKLTMPLTYRNLINHDITDDYTMGFAAQPGFRAGICTPFKWYDLEADVPTRLTIHPFALMEGTLRDYMKLNASEAMEPIRQLIDEVKQVNGTFISLWHNESLSDEKRWKGWVQVYKDMLAYAAP